MRRILAWAFGLALIGCGEADPEGVGAPCDSGMDCPTRSRVGCIQAWPGGYCTEFACTLGSCPEGARCVTGIQLSNVPFDAYCLETCDTNAACRDGYRCVDVNLPESVCAPSDA